MALCVAGAPSSPGAYKDRVDTARQQIDELLASYQEVDLDSELEILRRVGKLLPPTEQIEWQGGGVEVDNRWLQNRLQSARDTLEDDERRRSIIVEISERLAAISQACSELILADAVGRTKDEDKTKLAEILRRAEYQKPDTSDDKSKADKWLEELLAWIAGLFPKGTMPSGQTAGFASLQFWLQILIYAIVIGLVAFIIYKFAPMFVRRLAAVRRADAEDRVILGERLSSDESAGDLFSEAEALARAGNLRAAIRKGYIAALCDLSDRKLLRLGRNKTNRDYLADLNPRRNLRDRLAGLTLSFEQSWYGLRPVDESDWERFRASYRDTIDDIGREAKR